MLGMALLTLWAVYWFGLGIFFALVITGDGKSIREASTLAKVVLALSLTLWPMAILIGWIGEKVEKWLN